MKKIFPLALAAFTLMSFMTHSSFFVGKIVYDNSFTDLTGKDINAILQPIYGIQQQYFIEGKNYKAYNEMGNWKQLYNSKTNTYYSFNEQKEASKIDASAKTSQKVTLTPLDTVEKILGYSCHAIRMQSDNVSTIYFYSTELKIDTSAFMKHNYGDWNQYLRATGGALPLKYIKTDPRSNLIWTAVAKDISPMVFTDADFIFPDYLKLKN